MAHTAKVLTIAVAAYNVAPYIAQCLDSFVDEKLLPALDIVVIDDGSTDATTRIVKKYINRFPESFRLVSQENGGYGAAVNHALALAQGEYFKTVDGDDWVDTKELLTVVCYLMDNRERSDVVVTDYCWVRHRDGKEIRRIKTDFAQKQYQHIYSFDEIADKVYLEPLTVEFVEKVIEKERPDSLLAGMGGQTGLNLAVELYEKGILDKYNVKVIGTSIESIKEGEDRELFRDMMNRINQPVIQSEIITDLDSIISVLYVLSPPFAFRKSTIFSTSLSSTNAP